MVFEGKTILVAPLDWGLGHTTRCVALVRQLSEKNRVIFGVTSLNSFLLKDYFPQVEQVELPSYNIRYSKRLPQWLSVMLRLPAIRKIVMKERQVIENIVTKYKINVVISDNRYGAYYSGIPNIFVCHQVNLQMSFFSGIMNRLHAHSLRHFSEIWIPDYPDQEARLAGKLSDASLLSIKFRYIGPLSALVDDHKSRAVVYDYLFLLSGPEPQRTMLEEKLLGLVEGELKKAALVRGTQAPFTQKVKLGYMKDLCTGKELADLIKISRVVVCRSGYSTLMDLHVFGKKDLLLIPTPGQPEQEYLAKHWKKNFGANVIEQKELGILARTKIESLLDSDTIEH